MSKVINHRAKEQIIVMSVVEIFSLSFLFITLGVETNFSRVSNGRRKEAVKIVECFFFTCVWCCSEGNDMAFSRLSKLPSWDKK